MMASSSWRNHKSILAFTTASLSLLLLLVLLTLPNRASCIPAQELDSMLASLRARDYNLFANVVATSDLRFDLLSTPSLTVFAPSDSALFTLDMTLPGHAYLSALRSHVVPRRLSAAVLRRIPPGSVAAVPTLVPSRALRVTVRRLGGRINMITVNGVDLAFPGIYYSDNVAAHGLRGVLSFRTQAGTVRGSPQPQASHRRRPGSIFLRAPRATPPSDGTNLSYGSPVNLTVPFPNTFKHSRAAPAPSPEIQPPSREPPAGAPMLEYFAEASFPPEMSSVSLFDIGGADGGEERGNYGGFPGESRPSDYLDEEGSVEGAEPSDDDYETIEDGEEFDTWQELVNLVGRV